MSLASVLPDSELESAFSCAFRKLQYTTVVNVSAAVEDDLGDTLCRCTLGNQLADLFAASLFPPLPPKDFSWEVAAASVTPLTSSIT